jgi:hypothetical protein
MLLLQVEVSPTATGIAIGRACRRRAIQPGCAAERAGGGTPTVAPAAHPACCMKALVVD